MMRQNVLVAVTILVVAMLPHVAAAQETNTDKLTNILNVTGMIQTTLDDLQEQLTALNDMLVDRLAALTATQDVISNNITMLADTQSGIASRIDAMPASNQTLINIAHNITVLEARLTTQQDDITERLDDVFGDLGDLKTRLVWVYQRVTPPAPDPTRMPPTVGMLSYDEAGDGKKYEFTKTVKCSEYASLYNLQITQYTTKDITFDWWVGTNTTALVYGTYDTATGITLTNGSWPTIPQSEFRVTGEGDGKLFMTMSYGSNGKCVSVGDN